MAFTSAGFPSELVRDVFVNAQGHSSLAKLSRQEPLAFSGTDIMVFTLDGEVNLVAEGAAKGQHTGKNDAIKMVPLKVEYGQRVSDEFIRCSDEKRLDYMRAFTDGFGKKIARGLDIMALHGVNPATGTASALIGTNSLDTNTDVSAVTFVPGTPDPEGNINSGIAALGDFEFNGLAIDKTFASALADVKVNGVPQYPELAWGANPDRIKGVASDVNSTVSAVTGMHGYMGDFENFFRWGYADIINFEVIEYGDPDNSGNDLKGYNQVYLRAEAWFGWAILDGAAFARIEE